MFFHEGTPVIEPGICFLCEMVPSEGFVDTLRDFEPGYHTHLTGRKYVCVSCVRECGKLIGLKDAKALYTQVQNLRDEVDRLEASRHQARELLLS